MASRAPGRRHAKRTRHRLADPQREPSASDRRDWAGLPDGPAALIAERALANDVADYVRFRAVCRPWRACSDDPRSQSVSDRWFHPRHWIMLPRASGTGSRQRRFLSTRTGERIRVLVPDLRRYHILGRIAEGLLVVVPKRTHIVQLLNPLTGQLADFPHVIKTMLFDCGDRFLVGGKLRYQRVHSGGLADDSTVALVSSGWHCHLTFSVAMPGDEDWTPLWANGRLFLTLPFQGRLYCVTSKHILRVETAVTKKARLMVVADLKLEHELSWCWGDNYLYPVYDEGGLILVQRHVKYGVSLDHKLAAYRVELDTGVVERIHDLGGQALFVCDNRSQSVPARISSSLRADTVYVCNKVPNKDRPAFVAFDLSSGTCTVPAFKKRDVAYYLRSYVCS